MMRPNIRDFYKNRKDCPYDPKFLDQKLDFFKPEKQNKLALSTPGKQKEVCLERAAFEKIDHQRQMDKFGPMLMNSYRSMPPSRRRDIIMGITDRNTLLGLLQRESAPTHKGLIRKRIKELFPDEPIGNTEESPA